MGVLRGWLALSVAIALALLGAVWVVAGLLTPDLTPIHLPGLTEPSEPGDLLPILWRNSLVLALHATACVAGFIAGASMPIAAAQRSWLLALDPRQGGRAGDPLRLRRHPLLALHPGALPRLPGLDDRLPAPHLDRGPAAQRPPARPARADRPLPAARRLADRQPPRRVEPAPRRDLGHRADRDSRASSSRRRSRSTSGPTSSRRSRRSSEAS